MEIATIGYEKAALGNVLASLRGAGVTLLIDVRDRPQSRRAGFSKRMLSASTEAAGIGYLHLQALGTPREGRLANHARNWPLFWQIVDRQLATAEAQAALAEAAERAQAEPCCLLCYEADHRICHRSRVAELMQQRWGLVPRHLPVVPSFAPPG